MMKLTSAENPPFTMHRFPENDFEGFCSGLIGSQVTRLWRGYGSAIFLELGPLKPWRIRKDGSCAKQGEWTISVAWSWRIEGKRRIWLGSDSDKERWPRVLSVVEGATVSSVALTGRLPELIVTFERKLHLISFMTSDGNPDWTITKNRDDVHQTLCVENGHLAIKTSAASTLKRVVSNA